MIPWSRWSNGRGKIWRKLKGRLYEALSNNPGYVKKLRSGSKSCPERVIPDNKSGRNAADEREQVNQVLGRVKRMRLTCKDGITL